MTRVSLKVSEARILPLMSRNTRKPSMRPLHVPYRDQFGDTGDTQQGMRQACNRAKAMAEMRATDNVSPTLVPKLLRYAAYPGLLGR